jgi:hypothetical protein
MTLRRLVWLILILHISVPVWASTALAQRKITTTLLPATVASTPARTDHMLKIAADGSDPIKLTSTARLTFDLGGIPQEATVTKAILRLVGKTSTENPQLVKVFGDSSQDAIGTWTAVPPASPGESTFSTASDSLRQLIVTAIQARKPVALQLASTSRLSDWDYYALPDPKNPSAYPSAFKPRLIIEYERPAALQDPLEFSTPMRTSWKFFPAPEQVKVKPFFDKVSIMSNPAFYKGGMYLFGQPLSQKTSLYALSASGAEQWHKEMQDTPGSHALVTDTGRFYSVGENRIVRYDLENKGAIIKPEVSMADLKIAVPPTLGADGSLYFVPSGYGYVYGINPDQHEIWRYPAAEGTGSANVSRITLSPEAQQYAYLLTRRNNENTLVRINTTDGSATTVAISDTFTDFHRPVVVKGPEQDYIVVSAYSQSNGTLSVYSGGAVLAVLWENQGPLSQPIVDRAGKQVFVIQKGQLKAYDILNGKAVCTSEKTNLAATSNLVLDGEENLYFWNNGTLFGYRNNCQPLFQQALVGLSKDLELLFGPDGMLYAKTAEQKLFSLTPIQPALTLKPGQVQTDTVYSAETIQVATNLQVSKETHLILKAEKTIAFGPDFSVQKGARMRCQIGL